MPDSAFTYASASGDYRFDARRRGGAVVIRGHVLGPPGSTPYLVREFAHKRQMRAFRLAFHDNSPAIPFVELEFEHVEPNVPREVDLLQIHLPNEETVKIESRRGHPSM